jgi:hypothetical protein
MSTKNDNNQKIKHNNKQNKHPVFSAIAGIQTIKEVSDLAGVTLDKNLSPIALSLWSSVTEGLCEIMDGEAMGILIALILDIAHKGHSINDIDTIEVDQSGQNFSVKLSFKDDSASTATFH